MAEPSHLDFEKPISEMESRIAEMRASSKVEGAPDVGDELQRLEAKMQKTLEATYAKLNPWQRCQVARHPDRPHARHYIEGLIDDFIPLHGDRLFAEDSAILAGIGRFRGVATAILGQEKGSGTDGRIRHNFGMARPEGYRKAQRVMDLAERFRLPLLCFVDTPGAYPGVGAEERGQAEAIARTIERSLCMEVPIVSVVVGEGGSGGAMALATANTVLMLEHSIYSVISPEGCAGILWRSAEKSKEAAATALRLTAADLERFGVVDTVIPEPIGGAHRDPARAVAATGVALALAMQSAGTAGRACRDARRERFLRYGRVIEPTA